MFKTMKNIDTTVRHIRILSLAVVIGCIIICCFVTYKSYQLAIATQLRVYILANGKILEAFAAERKENIPVEARDHIETFHRLFFTLDPDDKVIRTNISKALYLADVSAKKQYESLREN